MKQSNLFSLNWRDALRSIAMAALSSGLTGVYKVIDNGMLPTAKDWRTIGLVALASAMAYLIKNFCTPADKK